MLNINVDYTSKSSYAANRTNKTATTSSVSSQATTDSVNSKNVNNLDNTSLSNLAKKLNTVKVGLKVGANLFSNLIQSYSLNLDGSVKDLKDFDVKQMVEDISTGYLYLTNSIKNDKTLSDSEKQNQLASLELQLNEGISEFSDNFAIQADSFLQKFGISNSGSEIIDSIYSAVQDQITNYSNIINPDNSDLISQIASEHNLDITNFDDFNQALNLCVESFNEEQQDEQTSQDNQNSNATANTDELSNSQESQLYNLNDLQALSTIAKNLGQVPKPNLNSSEEQIAFTYAMENLIINQVMDNGNVSEDLNKQINAGFKNYMNDGIKQQNTLLQNKQKTVEEYSSSNVNHYSNLNTSTINSIYTTIVNNSASTGNNSNGIENMIEGFEIAKQSFMQNQSSKSNLVRYSIGADFFNNFYQNNNSSYNIRSSFKIYANLLMEINSK